MAKQLYEILGASESDDTDAITRHYRRRSKQCHPDKHPGDSSKAEEFKAITLAFEVLTDQQRRAEYDKTGEIPPEHDDKRKAALGVLGRCLHKMLAADIRAGRKTKHRRLIRDMLRTIEVEIGGIEKQLADLRISREAIVDVADRITCRDGDNVLAALARAPLVDLDAGIAQGEDELAAHKEAWSLAEKFDFRSEQWNGSVSGGGWNSFRVEHHRGDQ